jgi:hypothetical protein
MCISSYIGKQEKRPARGLRVSGPFEILGKRSLLRHTGPSRQHARRVMMVLSVMEVQKTHLEFRVAFELSEVNPRNRQTGKLPPKLHQIFQQNLAH